MEFDFLPNQRRVIWLGSNEMQIALAEGGGHVAALRLPGMEDSANPYWQPPWPSLEPSAVTQTILDEEYGGNPEGRLLASILGHSLALDLYGPPSMEEAACGAVTHGRVGVQPWTWSACNGGLLGECHDLPAQLQFSRRVQVTGRCLVIEERVQNLCAWDRPLGWQQHVSFGPPFCEEGFWAWANCDCGCTHPQSFGAGASLVPNSETRWPSAPRRGGSVCDYRRPLAADAVANDFSGFRVRPSEELGGFVAGNQCLRFALFYLWPRQFFPWLGIWDEKHARNAKPWQKNASVRAYEFGVSPYPDTRIGLLRRPLLFDTSTYMILPASACVWVRYVMGVFPGVAEPGELNYSASAAKLTSGRREIGRVDLPESCACSVREDMNRS